MSSLYVTTTIHAKRTNNYWLKCWLHRSLSHKITSFTIKVIKSIWVQF